MIKILKLTWILIYLIFFEYIKFFRIDFKITIKKLIEIFSGKDIKLKQVSPPNSSFSPPTRMSAIFLLISPNIFKDFLKSLSNF